MNKWIHSQMCSLAQLSRLYEGKAILNFWTCVMSCLHLDKEHDDQLTLMCFQVCWLSICRRVWVSPSKYPPQTYAQQRCWASLWGPVLTLRHDAFLFCPPSPWLTLTPLTCCSSLGAGHLFRWWKTSASCFPTGIVFVRQWIKFEIEVGKFL